MQGFFINKKKCIFSFFVLWILFLFWGVFLFIPGCGSNPKIEDPLYKSSFAPTAIAPDRDTVFMQEVLENKQENILEIEVVANRIISGATVRAKFNVDFSGSVIRFDNFSVGNFLGEGEEAVYQVVTTQDNPNRVTVTITRTVPDNGVFGDGLLIVLRFKLMGIGSSQLLFESPQLYRQDGESLTFIDWFGGTVIVQ